MEEGLAARVMEWLSNEGYPLEYQTAAAFREAGFGTWQGRYTKSAGDVAPREMDVCAAVDEHLGDGRLLRLAHVVECKSSADKPWVIFCDRGISAAAAINQSIGSGLGEVMLWKEAGNPQLTELSLFSETGVAGFSGRQAFSGQKDLVFDTIRGVVGKARSEAARYDNPKIQFEIGIEMPRDLYVGLPLIVTDARLFEVHCESAEGDLQINEVKTSRIHWGGADRGPLSNTTVEIVTASALNDFVVRRFEELSIMMGVMVDAVAELVRCAEGASLEHFIVTSGARGTIGAPELVYKLDKAIEAWDEARETDSRELSK